MKLFTGWVLSAGLVFSAATANAQGLAPYQVGGPPGTRVSDVGGPYATVMPPEAPMPGYGPRYYEPSYEPALLPPRDVYAILRDNGFSPLGIPRQRGLFYVIGVIDRGGEDGRLVIDARNGRIIRFMPAYRMGDNRNDDLAVPYGPTGPLPPISNLRGGPRPPASVPQMASRTPAVPLPKAAPPHAGDVKPEVKPLAAKPAPEPAQQSAAGLATPPDVPAKPPSAVPIVEAKPTPQIQPTQAMPKAQGLE
jgi:hypothetical protein